MRRGYWKTLLRRLRGRVASGADTVFLHDTPFIITAVSASDDDALDPPALLPLAATADGNTFFVDTGSNLVTLGEGRATGLDLPGFIDALSNGADTAMDLGMQIDEADLLELQPRRKPLLGD